MHRWEKSNQTRLKPKQTHPLFDSQTPRSFSSFLHQSNDLPKIDEEQKLIFPRNRGRPFEEDKMPTLPTAFLTEKRPKKKVNDKVIACRRNPSFSSSPSSSSYELDLPGTLFYSSSETEHSVLKPPKSLPFPPRPKLDLDRNDKEAIFVKTRSRAQKIYSNLKSLKQPISPGARLTTLITSLFVKDDKTKNTIAVASVKDGDGGGGRKECKSESASTCSSTTSFSRSCLSRNNSKKRFEDGVKRTVRFCPVGIIVGEDSRPCGHKSLFEEEEDGDYEEQRKKLERENEKTKLKQQKQRQLEEMALDLLNGYWDSKLNKSHNQKVNDKANHDDYGVHYHDHDHDEDDDELSCSSSDLFELDHLSLVGDELPVYETTHFLPKIM